MPAPIAKRLTGTYIADSVRPMSSLVAWTQQECREGSLRSIVDSFAKDQSEPMDVGLILVEQVSDDGILARIPCKVVDHESPHAYLAEVWLKINPLVREARRVPQPA